jgi:sulfate-transporting ATPase
MDMAICVHSIGPEPPKAPPSPGVATSRYNAGFDTHALFASPLLLGGDAHAFGASMQYIYTMNGVSKIVPPKRQIIKDISLSFFPGAKIGLLGVNGAGKSTVLKIMAGVDTDFEGEATPQPAPRSATWRRSRSSIRKRPCAKRSRKAWAEILDAQKRLDEVYAAYAEEGADFDKLAAEQQKLEALLAAGSDAHALSASSKWPPTRCACRLGRQDRQRCPAVRSAAWRCAACCCPSPTCCCSTSPPTTLDAESVDWLEQFLQRLPGTVVARDP